MPRDGRALLTSDALDQAVYEVGSLLPDPAGRFAYSRAAGFTEWITLAAVIAEVIQAVLGQCNRTPEHVRSIAATRAGRTQEEVYLAALDRVRSCYSFFGRILFRGRIERTAADIADACLLAAAQADPGRLGAVMVVVREDQR